VTAEGEVSVDSLQITEKTEGRGSGADGGGGGPRKFRKGQPGNSAGRRKGSKNRKTLMAELLLEGEAEALARKAVELALGSSEAALRLCLDRLIAPRRERAVPLRGLPPIAAAGDMAAAMAVIIAAAGRGDITPGEAWALAQTIDTFVRMLEASEFERRLQLLENADRAHSGPPPPAEVAAAAQ
jgi:hypothetical protein